MILILIIPPLSLLPSHRPSLSGHSFSLHLVCHRPPDSDPHTLFYLLRARPDKGLPPHPILMQSIPGLDFLHYFPQFFRPSMAGTPSDLQQNVAVCLHPVPGDSCPFDLPLSGYAGG